MGGTGARFGVELAAVPALLRQIAREPALRLRGLHVYGGTQCFQAQAFVQGAAALCEFAAQQEREQGLLLDELDLGGGFGVATYLGDPEFDLEAAGDGVRALVQQHDRPGRRFFVELGRWLVGPTGIYAARVVRSKQSGDVRHLALDGGMHHCAVAAGAGSVLRRPPLLVAANALTDSARQRVAVGGPLCTPQDEFADAVLLPPCAEGDLLAVLAAGAYGQSYSPVGFLSHPAPAEVLVQRGEARVIRARGEPADVLRGQRSR
jgi:diaminopimelate decarboxylase